MMNSKKIKLILLIVGLVSFYYLTSSKLLFLYDPQQHPSLYKSYFIAIKGSEIKAGDIAIFNYKEQLLVKQVVALNQATIKVVAGAVYQLQDQQWLLISSPNNHALQLKEQLVNYNKSYSLQHGQYWLNSNHPWSFDSRYFGPLEHPIAKVWWSF